MFSHFQAGCILAGLLSVAHVAVSSPIGRAGNAKTPASALHTRMVDFYVDCNGDQEGRLDHGFADAAVLSGWAVDQPIDTSSTA